MPQRILRSKGRDRTTLKFENTSNKEQVVEALFRRKLFSLFRGNKNLISEAASLEIGKEFKNSTFISDFLEVIKGKVSRDHTSYIDGVIANLKDSDYNNLSLFIGIDTIENAKETAIDAINSYNASRISDALNFGSNDMKSDFRAVLSSSPDTRHLILDKMRDGKKWEEQDLKVVEDVILMLNFTGDDADIIVELFEEDIRSPESLCDLNSEKLKEIIHKSFNYQLDIDELDKKSLDILQKVESEYPSAFFLHRVAQQPDWLSLDKQDRPVVSENFKKFYINNKGFDLLSEPVIDVETGQLNKSIKGVEGSPELIRELTLAQQCLQLSQDSDIAALMMAKQFSVHKAVKSTPAAIMRELDVDEVTARQIKTKAEDMHEVAINGYFAYRDMYSSPFLKNVLENLSPVQKTVKEGIGKANQWDKIKLNNGLKELNSIEDLFGSQNFCECESCQSVLSPAAYFVDLMRFIEDRVLMSEKDANGIAEKLLDVNHPIHLKQRRPDLWDLPLTCANTNKSISYVGIVNEVLKAFIRKHLGNAESVESRLLSEKPKLEFLLPYDADLEEVRVWLGFFKKSRVDVLEFLHPSPSQAETVMLAAERLGLSPKMYDIIIDQAFNAEVGKDVLAFRRKSGLGADETERFTQLAFWDNKLSAVQKPVPGDLQQFKLEFESSLAKWEGIFHRLFRLWKASGWSLMDLDIVLQTFSIRHNDLNPAAILKIAAFKRIQQQMGYSPEQISALIAGLSAVKAEEKELTWRNLLPSTWTPNVSVPLAKLVEGIEDKPVKVLLELQGIFGLSTGEVTGILQLITAKIGDPIEFKAEVLDQIYRYVQIYRFSGTENIEAFGEYLKIWGGGQVKYFDDPFRDLIDFVTFTETCPLEPEDTLYVWGDGYNIATLVEEDKAALEAPEIRDFIKQDLFQSPAHFGLLFNKWLGIDIVQLGYFRQFLEQTDAALDGYFADLKNDQAQDATYIALSNMKARLERLQFLFDSFGLNGEVLQLITVSAAQTKALQFGFTEWKKMNWVKELKTLGTWFNETKLISGFDLLGWLTKTGTGDPLSAKELRSIAKWQKVNLAQVQTVLVQTESITQIQSIWDKLAMARSLHLNYELLDKFSDNSNFPDQAELLSNAVRATFSDNESWQAGTLDFKNKLSSSLRDALCSFVIFNKELRDRNFGFQDRESLYQYFLLDVGMGDCFTLPRIVAATNSLQVYIHRALMGLERSADEKVSVLLDLDEAQEWEWRKNYRVWEANRRIFLYPENYVEATIRDNKTPEFIALEDELLQQKLNLEVVENAYKKYLEQVMVLAELRMAGAYYDRSYNRIYLFAKTNKQPLEYYFRYLEFYESGGLQWSNWEKMNVSIPAEDISAIRHNGKLHVFWTSYQRKDISTVNNGTSEIAQYTYDVFLNYSYLKVDKKWSPPQKVAIGYRINSPFDAFLRNDEFETHVKGAASEKPSFDEDADSVRENALAKFEKTVYRKPYPMFAADKKDLRFAMIWTDRKDALVPRYKQTNAIIDAFTVSVKIRVDVFFIEIEQDIEFTFDRIDRVVAVPTSPNQEQAPANLSISSKTYTYEFGEEKLQMRMEFSKQGADSYRYSLKTLGNGNNKMFFFKDPNAEVKSGEVMISHRIDYIPVSEISYKSEWIDMANQSEIRMFQKVNTLETYYKSEYQTYFDSFRSFYVTDGSLSFASNDRACKVQQMDMVSVLTTPAKPDTDNGYNLNPENIQMLWDKIAVGVESLLDTQSSQRHLVNQIDYSKSFGNYFYELFFHIPMRIADHLNAEGLYKEANYWYGFIYNPTAVKEKFEQLAFPYDVNWRFAAFRNMGIQKLKKIYGDPVAIEMYRRSPGNPHAIARMRIGAYQKHVVMKYLDNLLDWADNLFEQYTPESTSEARNLYSMVKTILGNKPESTGKCKDAQSFTYSDIRNTSANEFIYNLFTSQQSGFGKVKENEYAILEEDDNAEAVGLSKISRGKGKYKAKTAKGAKVYRKEVKGMKKDTKLGKAKIVDLTAVKVENKFASFKPSKDVYRPHGPTAYFDLERDLAFCFPANQDFINYWVRVDDRIFKLNHCLDINGVKKEMPAYAPPIDPMMLARMVAGGLSFDEITAALNAKLPNHRFVYLVEKAKQYAGIVQGFGQALFSAIERKDGEELTLIRARHEKNILSLTSQIKKQQIEQAKTSLQVLLENKKGLEIRKAHYESLIEEDLIPWERTEQIAKWTAGGIRITEGVLQFLSGGLSLIPQVGSPFAMKYGGVELSSSASRFANALDATAKIADNIAVLAGMEAGHQRRAQEWQHQVVSLSQELTGMYQQIRNAEISVQVAEMDLEMHLKNVEQNDELYDFYQTKFTGFNHYTFQVRQLQQLYRMAYNLAYDAALQAERAFAFERFGMEGVLAGIIKNDNWSNERAGLLAGERLNLQLMQLEQEFIQSDRRKIEITQHFSMLQLSPDKLLTLKTEGECSDFVIPEAAFDLVYPGYFRRIIKSVRVSIPCIAGPYTNIGATLTLGNNKIRVNKTDALTDFNFTGCSTIATSTAQNDGGQFELNFRDERYLPFEGAGAVSSWTLALPKTIRAFDYNTIADVVFHVSYTAEYDGVYKGEVENAIKNALNAIQGTGMTRVFSLRHDFPREWMLVNDPNTPNDVILQLRREHFPYFAQVDRIKGIVSKAYTISEDGKMKQEADSLGITKSGNFGVKIPLQPGGGELRDLIFIVEYECS